MKNLILAILIGFSINFYGQCTFTVVTTFTPASCPTCCDGKILATYNGPGMPCLPYGWILDPGSVGSPSGTWNNLCPGTYTISLVTGCCTIYGICGLPSSSTGIQFNLKNESGIQAFPNPVSNILYLETDLSFEMGTEIEVINILGQSFSKQFYKNEIDVSALSGGVYFLRIKNDRGQVIQKRFIVSR